MDPLIRPATPEDAAAIASVHVQSWQETYAGLIPPDFLAHMTSAEMRERRAASWRATIDQAREAVRVAEQAANSWPSPRSVQPATTPATAQN